MTRGFVTAATVLGTVLLASVTAVARPAAAAVPDPAHAVKRRLAAGQGVRTSETVRISFGGTTTASGYRSTGRVRLARTGPAAVAVTWRDVPGRDPAHSAIRIGNVVYCDAGQYPIPVPDGRRWVAQTRRAGFCWTMAQRAGLQPIDVYDPAMLRAVLRRSTRTAVRGGHRYQGALTYRELSKIVPKSYRNPATNARVTATSKGRITWRLFTGRDGLPTRLVTVNIQGSGKSAVVMRVDTRYSAWGRRITITAPPAAVTIAQDDLYGPAVPDPEPASAAAN